MEDQQGLYFALDFLRIAVPALSLGTVLITYVGSLLARLFNQLQVKGYAGAPTGETVEDRPIAERTPLVDEHGITPVVVLEKQRRSWLILTLLNLVALTYLIDAAIFTARGIIDDVWESDKPLWKSFLLYITSGFLAFAIMGIALAWATAKGRRSAAERWTPVILAALTLGGEAAMLGCLASLYQSLFHGHVPLYPALHLSALVVRLTLLLFLCLSFHPIMHRATYRTPPNVSNGNGYGTFGDNSNSKSEGAPAGPAPPPSAGFFTLLNRVRVLSPYLWPRKSFVLKCIALACFSLLVVGRAINPLAPIYLGSILEDFRLSNSPWHDLGIYVALRFMQGNGGILTVLQSNLWIPVSQYSDREMSMMTFNHLLNLSLSYHTKRKTGEVLRVLDRGAAINNFFQMLIFNIFPMSVDIIIAIVVFAFKFGIFLSLCITLVMVAYVTASVLLTQYRVKLRRSMNDKDKFCRSIHTDTLLNWETVKFFTAESYESKRYRAAMQDYQKTEFQVMASLNLLNMVQNFIISIGLLVGSLIVTYGVTRHTLNPGDFVSFIAYLGQLYAPLTSLGTLYRVIQSNLVDTDNLMKLLAEEKEVVDKEDAFELLKADGEIEFQNVDFSYDGKVQALSDVSFRIPAGTSAAFVGESGGGKSTILRLLYRFYDIQSGSIKVDGHDVRDLTQFSLRRQIGVVPQDAVLFNESIKYNIGYGDPEAAESMERVEAAAKAAQIHDRILSFPEGYDTKVGERGIRLSGGEKQRVAIARTMLKSPPILLLDEATSALDTSTEREIQAALRNLASGRTSLSIAHRLSTIVHADTIFVVQGGRIVESGSHADLVAKNGIFADLWAKQIRAEVEGIPPPGAKDGGGGGLAPVAKSGLGQGTSSGTATPVPSGHPHH